MCFRRERSGLGYRKLGGCLLFDTINLGGKVRDVDVVLDFAGHPPTTLQALRALARGGRIMIVAINLRELAIDPYRDLLARERHIIGVSDHTREELVELLQLAQRGVIDISRVITRRVSLDAAAINEVLDDLDRGTKHLRTVIPLSF